MTTSNTISSIHSLLLTENDDSTFKKAQESDTTDSLSLHKIPPSIPNQKVILDLKPNSPRKEENSATIKKPSQAKVFDIRVGLGLTKTQPDTLRKQFEGLLPYYLAARISKSHLTLLNILEKIDNYLIFQKEMRSKPAVFFSELVKNVNQNYFIDMGTMHLRQILFLGEELYTYKIEKKRTSYDIKIQTSFKNEGGETRRTTLRRLIFDYLNGKHEGYLRENGLEWKEGEGYWHQSFSVDIGIPMLPFPWEGKGSKGKESKNKGQEILKEDLKDWKDTNIEKVKQKGNLDTSTTLSQFQSKFIYQNPLKKKQTVFKQILTKSKTQGESFRQKLYRTVAERQAKQRQLDLQKEQKKKTQTANQTVLERITKQLYLKVIDQINMIYISRNVSNIFHVVLVQLLNKRTEIIESDIQDIIKDILSYESYLTEVRTNKGVIVKVDRSEYKGFKAKIQEKEL